MAAIFALVLVPALAAVLCILGGIRDLTFSTGLGAVVFVALVTGLLTGLFRLAHTWEEEPGDHHHAR